MEGIQLFNDRHALPMLLLSILLYTENSRASRVGAPTGVQKWLGECRRSWTDPRKSRREYGGYSGS